MSKHDEYIYASHVHTHSTIYANVYTCTHCDRKGHLTKFYYYRINALTFVSNNVWARSTNPHGPKKVWVPKFIPISFEIGMGSHKM